MPRIVDETTTISGPSSAVRAPKINRLNRSRPSASVPSQCAAWVRRNGTEVDLVGRRARSTGEHGGERHHRDDAEADDEAAFAVERAGRGAPRARVGVAVIWHQLLRTRDRSRVRGGR